MRTILAALLILNAGAASALDCDKLLKIHSFLSRAQFQCGIDKYSEQMLAQAKECGQHLSEKRVNENLKSGIALFDARERERGHAKMCSDVLDTFPQVLSR